MAVTRSSNRLLSFLSFSTPAQMMWALVLGIVCGLFFGEQVAWMQMLGDGMILLMQMTVFPYILVSLIAGIGKLDKASAQLLFREAGFILLSLWVLGLVCVFALMWILPPFESASFFNPSSVQTPTPIDYFKLYIPSNPFSSMAEGAVPAMVIFSLAVGFALMTLPERQQMLGFLSVATQALSKVTQALVKILPIGIFCMS
ncbi:MAG: cation:dicarboxylase symporter family transporter, partial [Pseudomonadales bacterium]|nr:cation:dicarboxylase symporter family transporter [Pseudomonadales bacterium]